MSRLILHILAAGVLSLAVAGNAGADLVTSHEAERIAANWINLKLELEDDWGGSEYAEVDYVEEFMRGDRLLGYCCHVLPSGFIMRRAPSLAASRGPST